jgi:SAM-dependent methyltransferase
MMAAKNLLQNDTYSSAWIKDFYDQTGIWWGADSEIAEEDQWRARSVERLCGTGPKRILELGCGAGHTAAATATLGHTVTGIDISTRRIQQARENFPDPREGSLTFIEADFYAVQLKEKFDVVIYWDGFGVLTDADHRRLFQRAAQDWLAPGGSFLVEVANTVWVTRNAGKEMRLDPLEGVPGSVEMLRRWHFDALHSRWIDEWVPVEHPENALAQTLRCYTPADFILLAEGTGLRVNHIEVKGQPIDLTPDKITLNESLLTEYSFLAQLVAG